MRARIRFANAVMNIGDLAKQLNVNRSTIFRLVRRGELKAFRIASDWRFNREDVDQWLRAANSSDRMLRMVKRSTAALAANVKTKKKQPKK